MEREDVSQSASKQGLILIAALFFAFLCITLVSLSLLRVSELPCIGSIQFSKKAKRPNIVFILTDDQDFTLGGMVSLNLIH